MIIANDSRIFWRNDPMLYLLRDKLNLSDPQIILIAFVVTFILHHIFGWIANNVYLGNGVRYTDPNFFYFNLSWLLIFTPFIWAFYLWQPEAIDRALDNLEKNNVIGLVKTNSNSPISSISEFRQRFAHSMTRKLWYWIAITLIVVFWLYGYFVTWPIEFELIGELPFWITVTWFTPLFLVGYSITLYVLWVFVMRQIQTIYYFNRLFHWFEVRIIPLYPDEAGGLGAIGEFTIRAGMIAIGIGILTAIYGGYIWSNTGNFLRSDVVALFILYIIIASSSILLPMVGAHQAMKEARTKNLEEVSKEFSKIISESKVTVASDSTTIKKTNEKLLELKQMYQLVHDAYPVWPVSLRAARNFSITAALPLLPGLISVVIEYAIS